MKKHHPTNPSDITLETYKGPSATVAGAGAAFWLHNAMALGGLLLGGLLTYCSPKIAGGAVRGLKNKVEVLAKSEYRVPALLGLGLEKFLSIGEGLVKAVRSYSKNADHFLSNSDTRLATAVDGAVALGSAGFISGFFVGGSKGVASAHRGREQFERAKEQIRDERAINAELREKYAAAQAELEIHQKPEKKLHVTQDDPTATTPQPSHIPTPATAGPDAPVKVEQRATHHATQHAPSHASHAEKIAAAHAQQTEAARG